MSDRLLLKEGWIYVVAIGGYHGSISNRWDDVPDDEVRTKGGFRIMDPKVRQWPATFKNQVVKEILKVGTRLIKGNMFYVPDHEVEALNKKIEVIRAAHNEKKIWFVANAPRFFSEWAEKHPEDREIILANIPPVGYIEDQLHFRVPFFGINDEKRKESDGMDYEVGSVVSNIAKEIASLTRETFDLKQSKDPSVKKRLVDCYSRKKWSTYFNTVAKKCDALGFVSPKVGKIAALIREVDKTLPCEGNIADRDYLVLKGLISILRDPNNLLSDELHYMIESSVNSARANDSAAPSEVVCMPAVVGDASFEDSDQVPVALPGVVSSQVGSVNANSFLF